MAASSARRREKDVMALLMSNYDVDLGNASGDFGVSQESHSNGSGGQNASSSNSSTTNGSGGTGQGHQSSSGSGGVNASGLIEEFTVKFKGPEDTPYEGGLWYVSVRLPQQYPFKSPSIGFRNKMFHPNVDESSGSVCLDVISQTWTPMYDLVNIFEQFLPQLLRYPNPTDPLNGEAAHLLLREPEQYKKKVKDYVFKFATEASLNGSTDTSAQNGRHPGASSPTQKATDTAETMEDMEMDDDNHSDVSELSDL